MRIDGINKTDCIYTKLQLNKDNMDKTFEILAASRRDVKKSTVHQLFKLLEDGKHFETPLMANCNNGGRYRLLDGNHRYEAMQKYFDKYPERKVEIAMFYYKDLSEAEEKQMYTAWNLGRKQSTDDFIKQYWSSFRIAKLMKNDFPFPISAYNMKGMGGMSMRQFIMPYITNRRSEDGSTFLFHVNHTAMDIVEKIQVLGHNDHKLLKQFAQEYINAFGPPNNVNKHYIPIIYNALASIWFDNRLTENPSKLATAFSRVADSPIVYKWSTFSGNREAVVACHDELLLKMNGKKVDGRLI